MQQRTDIVESEGKPLCDGPPVRMIQDGNEEEVSCSLDDEWLGSEEGENDWFYAV